VSVCQAAAPCLDGFSGSREESTGIRAEYLEAAMVRANLLLGLGSCRKRRVPDAQLALQLPQGWTATPVGATDFTSVAPGTAPTATFQGVTVTVS